MRKNICFFLTCFLFVGLSQAFGITYSVGGHTVDVEVRNSALNLVIQAKVRCWMSGGNIVINVTATGYKGQRLSITPGSPGGYFTRDVLLEDVDKLLVAQDLSGRPIKSVYFQKDQYGFDSREYGITAHIPKETWKKPTSRNVDVFDLLWGVPLKIRCEIEELEGYYKVRMAISRRAVDWTSEALIVVFDTRSKLMSEDLQVWLMKLEVIEGNAASLPSGAANRLATFLFHTLPRAQVEKLAGDDIPSSLKALYDQEKKFSALHRDNSLEKQNHLN